MNNNFSFNYYIIILSSYTYILIYNTIHIVINSMVSVCTRVHETFKRLFTFKVGTQFIIYGIFKIKEEENPRKPMIEQGDIC